MVGQGETSVMAIRFDTRDYERTHGRPPRGLGMWHFDVVGHHKAATHGTLTVAKRNVRALLREEGIRDATVLVLP